MIGIVIVSNSIILDNTQFGVQTDMNNSRIAWDNALSRGVLSSAQDPDNLPNLFDNMTTTFWNAGSGTVDVDITLSPAETIDCAGVVAGNWADAGTIIEVYTDFGITKVGEVSGLKNGQPYYFDFDPITTSQLRIRFISSGDLKVGQVLFGESLKVPKAANVGLQLGQFNNRDDAIGQLTENNAFGGNSVVARGRDTVAPYSLIPVSWLYEKWVYFSDNHKGKPVWFAWDHLNNPNDVTYGHWQTNNVGYTKSTFADLTLTVKGVV